MVAIIGEYQNVNFGEVSSFFIASKSKIDLELNRSKYIIRFPC